MIYMVDYGIPIQGSKIERRIIAVDCDNDDMIRKIILKYHETESVSLYKVQSVPLLVQDTMEGEEIEDGS